MATALDHLPQVLEEMQSTGSAVNKILDNFPHHTIQTSSSDFRSIPGDTHNSITQIGRSNACKIKGSHLQLQGTHTVSRCHLNCLCRCHKTSFSWISGPLAPILGRARLERTDPSWTQHSPHIRSCKASGVSYMQIIYFLPTWFAMKAIYIRYTSSPLHGPEWLLRIPRLVDSNKSRAFRSIRRGDLPGFKLAIASGECTPDDIDERGISLLRVSVSVDPLQGSELKGLFIRAR